METITSTGSRPAAIGDVGRRANVSRPAPASLVDHRGRGVEARARRHPATTGQCRGELAGAASRVDHMLGSSAAILAMSSKKGRERSSAYRS